MFIFYGLSLEDELELELLELELELIHSVLELELELLDELLELLELIHSVLELELELIHSVLELELLLELELKKSIVPTCDSPENNGLSPYHVPSIFVLSFLYSGTYLVMDPGIVTILTMK